MVCDFWDTYIYIYIYICLDVEISQSGWKGREVCDEHRKRMINVRCLQVRWRGQAGRMLGMKGRREKLSWSGKGDGAGGVGFMVKEELGENWVEVRRETVRVMTVFEVDVMRWICGYVLQSTLGEKQYFYDELKGEWDMHCAGNLATCFGDLNG